MSLDDRNEALEKKLEENPIDQQIATLVRADKHRKTQVRWLTFTIMFDVLLTIGFGYITFRTHQLAVQADTNKAAIVRSCETANISRANNKQLWDYIFNIPPTEPNTPERQARIDDFRAFVNETFAPRDCQAEINKQ